MPANGLAAGRVFLQSLVFVNLACPPLVCGPGNRIRFPALDLFGSKYFILRSIINL